MEYPEKIGYVGLLLICVAGLLTAIGIFANIPPYVLDVRGYHTDVLSSYGATILGLFILGCTIGLVGFAARILKE